MIQERSEIYLDQFVDCLEGLLDGIDLLYGAEVTLTLHNIQPLLKFILLYKVGGMLEGCFGWIKNELSMVNLFTFLKVGLFVKTIDCEDVLRLCKEFILTCSADELLDASETWSIDEKVFSFILDEELLSVTLPTVANWVSCESRVVMVLDRVEKCRLQKILSQIPTLANSEALPPIHEAAALSQADMKSSNPTLQLLNKMQEVCDNLSTSKRVFRLSSFILVQNYLQTERVPIPKLFHQPQYDSMSLLKDTLWRHFDCHQIASLCNHHQIEGFFFAEIVLDWVRFTEPTEERAEQLWGIVGATKISKAYLQVVRNSFSLAYPKAKMGMAQGKNVYMFRADSYKNPERLVRSLTGSDSPTSISMEVDCKVKACEVQPKSKHCKVFQLSDTTPCYQLEVEGAVGPRHYHHDIIHHWYATELKDRRRVLLSFSTNTMAEVIEKVRISRGIRLHFLQPTSLLKD